MTIKKRLARSNLMMLVIPVLTAGVLLIIGLAAALFLLQTVYLPQMGLSLRELHRPANRSKRCFRVLRLSPAYTRVR